MQKLTGIDLETAAAAVLELPMPLNLEAALIKCGANLLMRDGCWHAGWRASDLMQDHVFLDHECTDRASPLHALCRSVMTRDWRKTFDIERRRSFTAALRGSQS